MPRQPVASMVRSLSLAVMAATRRPSALYRAKSDSQRKKRGWSIITSAWRVAS